MIEAAQKPNWSVDNGGQWWGSNAVWSTQMTVKGQFAGHSDLVYFDCSPGAEQAPPAVRRLQGMPELPPGVEQQVAQLPSGVQQQAAQLPAGVQQFAQQAQQAAQQAIQQAQQAAQQAARQAAQQAQQAAQLAAQQAARQIAQQAAQRAEQAAQQAAQRAIQQAQQAAQQAAQKAIQQAAQQAQQLAHQGLEAAGQAVQHLITGPPAKLAPALPPAVLQRVQRVVPVVGRAVGAFPPSFAPPAVSRPLFERLMLAGLANARLKAATGALKSVAM